MLRRSSNLKVEYKILNTKDIQESNVKSKTPNQFSLIQCRIWWLYSPLEDLDDQPNEIEGAFNLTSEYIVTSLTSCTAEVSVPIIYKYCGATENKVEHSKSCYSLAVRLHDETMASKGWFVTILPIICLTDKSYLFKKLKHFFKALPLCYEMVESENIFCSFLIDYHNAAPIVHGVQMNNELLLIWKFHHFSFPHLNIEPFFFSSTFLPFQF